MSVAQLFPRPPKARERLPSPRSFLLLLVLMGVCLSACPVRVSASTTGPAAPPGSKGEPLEEEEFASGSFQYLQQITGLGRLGLHMLYASSGAEDYQEFARALVVSHNLRLNRQLVLQALRDQDLKKVLLDFGLTKKQVEEALKLAKKQIKEADRNWEKGRRLG